MLKAKEIARRSEKYLQKLEQSGFVYERQEMLEMEQTLVIGLSNCEISIESLTSEEMGPLIANSEQLLDKMLKYQEQIMTAMELIQPFAQEVKQAEKIAVPNNSKSGMFNTNAN